MVTRALSMVLFAIVVTWDGFTTIMGSMEIATRGLASNALTAPVGGDDPFVGNAARGAVFGMVLFLIVMFMFARTDAIWKQDGASGFVFKLCWVVALAFDAFTSYQGNRSFIFKGVSDAGQFFFNITATALTIGAVMFFATHLGEKESKGGGGGT